MSAFVEKMAWFAMDGYIYTQPLFLLLFVALLVVHFRKKPDNKSLVRLLFLGVIGLPLMLEWSVRLMNFFYIHIANRGFDTDVDLTFVERTLLTLVFVFYLWSAMRGKRKYAIKAIIAMGVVWLFAGIRFLDALEGNLAYARAAHNPGFSLRYVMSQLFKFGHISPFFAIVGVLALPSLRKKMSALSFSWLSGLSAMPAMAFGKRQQDKGKECGHCRKMNDSDANFCTFCGKQL